MYQNFPPTVSDRVSNRLWITNEFTGLWGRYEIHLFENLSNLIAIDRFFFTDHGHVTIEVKYIKQYVKKSKEKAIPRFSI